MGANWPRRQQEQQRDECCGGKATAEDAAAGGQRGSDTDEREKRLIRLALESKPGICGGNAVAYPAIGEIRPFIDTASDCRVCTPGC